MLHYQDHIDRLRPSHPKLAQEVAQLSTLEQVLAWLPNRGLSLATFELVTQDELSHDALLPLDPDGSYLVFGLT